MGYKNVSARLLTINAEGGESLTLAPGESGNLKGKLGNAQDFVDSLIATGELTEVADVKETKSEGGAGTGTGTAK